MQFSLGRVKLLPGYPWKVSPSTHLAANPPGCCSQPGRAGSVCLGREELCGHSWRICFVSHTSLAQPNLCRLCENAPLCKEFYTLAPEPAPAQPPASSSLRTHRTLGFSSLLQKFLSGISSSLFTHSQRHPAKPPRATSRGILIPQPGIPWSAWGTSWARAEIQQNPESPDLKPASAVQPGAQLPGAVPGRGREGALTSLALGPGEAVDTSAAVGPDAPAPVLAAVLTHSCEGKQRTPSLLLLECQSLEYQLHVLPSGASVQRTRRKSEILTFFLGKIVPCSCLSPFLPRP